MLGVCEFDEVRKLAAECAAALPPRLTVPSMLTHLRELLAASSLALAKVVVCEHIRALTNIHTSIRKHAIQRSA